MPSIPYVSAVVESAEDALAERQQVEIPALTWGVHRLGGVLAPVSATFTANELARRLAKVRAKALFTVVPL